MMTLDEACEEIERQRAAILAAEGALIRYRLDGKPLLVTQDQIDERGYGGGFWEMSGDGYAPAFRALRMDLIVAEARYDLACHAFDPLWRPR